VTALGLLASQLAILAAGYALLRALGLAELRVSDARLIGLGYLAGWASTGILLTLALVLEIGESLPVILAVLALQIGICLWLGRKAEPVGPPTRPVAQSRHPLAIAVCWVSGTLIAIAVLSAAAVASKAGWDSRHDFDAANFWIPKAEVLHHSHGLDAALWKLFAHTEYPPLAPAMDAFTFFFTGVHPSLLMTQRTILGIAFLWSLLTLLGRLAPRWVLLPFVAALATAPWFWPRLTSVMVDAPVAYLVSGAAVTGFLWLHEGRRCWLVLAGVFLAAATLTKFEGFFFSEILALVLAAAAVYRYRRRAAPVFALIAAPFCIALWWVWLGRHGLSTRNSGDYHLSDVFDPHFLSDRASRLSRTLTWYRWEGKTLLSGLFGGWPVPASGWLLVVPLAVAFVLASRRNRLLGVAAAGWVVAALAGLAVIYWIGRPPINWYLHVSLDRVAPSILIAGAALATMLLGLELGRSGHATEMVAVPRGILAGRRRGLAAALGAVVAALAVVALADSRPGVHRTGAIDEAGLARELTRQVTQELNSGGYPYHITSACHPASATGLQFLCLAQTTSAVGRRDPKVLYWNITVSCAAAASSTPRCTTSQGEALN
jgi:hypothetical protein